MPALVAIIGHARATATNVVTSAARPGLRSTQRALDPITLGPRFVTRQQLSSARRRYVPEEVLERVDPRVPGIVLRGARARLSEPLAQLTVAEQPGERLAHRRRARFGHQAVLA